MRQEGQGKGKSGMSERIYGTRRQLFTSKSSGVWNESSGNLLYDERGHKRTVHI